MKKLILMFMLMAIAPAYAADNSEIVEDSVKTEKCYENADMVITSGVTMFTVGLIYRFTASSTVGVITMGAGGVLTGVGIIMKISNAVQRKKNGNRGS